ncbi:disease resistance protein RPM1-like [Prosopis cineraria]|uniref:disease resistance protein RPM1-like n=1 Tax=Prosopis cineraria TaxID=364024 RepID=UPI00240EA04C|nr:disease resistance protein RPM1-like [Prosopis cineraria]XP_054818466.1 disease resistance protein RPM1-like [Prosopis cineraria]
MAEIAINLVIDKLVPLVLNEVKLHRDVPKHINFIKHRLNLVKAYLKDADEQAERTSASYLVKEWVKQVREIAFRIEDVIDECLFSETKKRARNREFIGRGFFKTMSRHQIKDEIVAIGNALDDLYKTRETLGLNLSTTELIRGETRPGYDPRQGSRFMDEAELVGINETKQRLIDWLSREEGRSTIISVVGEGGLGKTTIVNNLYEKQKRWFDCCAWITVSRSLEGGLLRSLTQSLCGWDDIKEADKKVEADKMTSKLREYLLDKKYMVVFDDAWNEYFWAQVKFALPHNGKDNRIMITTRNKRIAKLCRLDHAQFYIHELKPLSQQDAFKLFSRKVFGPSDHIEETNPLMKLSQDFVSRCNGVPFAIVAIAGLLSTKRRDALTWEKVRDSLNQKITNDPSLKGYFEVILESYDDLDYHLKLCLLYFGLFPKAYSISSTRLINLWIAEGFVKRNSNDDPRTIEEVAGEYLEELIHRSLVKVSAEYSDGRVRRCHIHDLMHTFVLNKGMDQNFCQVIRPNHSFDLFTRSRRLSILAPLDIPSAKNYDTVKSCFVFKSQQLEKPLLQSFLSHFKLLIALDFEGAPLDHLPKAVENLFLLKYLNLRKTQVKTIPKFIGNLLNLEILDLKHTLVIELSASIYHLIRLRHLIAYSSYGVQLKKGISCLNALQKLTKVDVSNEGGVIEELIHLTQMRKLGIINLKRKNGKSLCRAIQEMKHLCSLSIVAFGKNEVLDLPSITKPPRYLQRINFDGPLEKLPNWIPKLRHLVKLRLARSRLRENKDLLYDLKDLTELVDLSLLRTYEGEELHFKAEWFKKLKVLTLQSMDRLKIIRVEEGAMPLLEDLHLGFCPQMIRLPDDVEKLNVLKSIYLAGMSDEFQERMVKKDFSISPNLSSVTYKLDGHNLRIYP